MTAYIAGVVVVVLLAVQGFILVRIICALYLALSNPSGTYLNRRKALEAGDSVEGLTCAILEITMRWPQKLPEARRIIERRAETPAKGEINSTLRMAEGLLNGSRQLQLSRT